MVKKVLIDTNVWLRYFLKDHKIQFKACKKLIELVEEGKISPYVSAIVFLELHYVLSKVYQIRIKKVEEIIEAILTTRNLVIINKTDFKKAFLLSKKYKIKLSDCLIASSLPKNCALISWDKELKKLKTIKVSTPKEILVDGAGDAGVKGTD